MSPLSRSFANSLDRLREVLQMEKTVANRDSAIKRFEFTTELAWKVIQTFMREQSIICRGPKECLREAFRFGLLVDDKGWLEMIDDRNMTVHTYSETAADDVFSRLPQYLDLFDGLKNKLSTFSKE